MSSLNFGRGPAVREYSAEHDNQLQPEDTLIDRGIDDVLDEGYSPPERPYGRAAYGPSESIDQHLAEEELDPLSRIGNPFDNDEQRRSDEAERETEFPQRREVGRVRAGRLVAPDRGFGETPRRSWWPRTSVPAGEQRLPKRQLFISSTTANSSSAPAPFGCE